MQVRKVTKELAGLMYSIRQRHKEFLMVEFQKLGLKTSSRGTVLCAIYEHEGLVQDEISSKLGMDKAFVTRELNTLGEMGLIYRHKDPEDHRRNHVYLTDEGRKVGEAVVKIECDWLDMAYRGLSLRDCESMKRFIERVSDNVQLS